MAISRHHAAACPGDGCTCPWRLDFRPQGLAGPRKRIEFPTRRAAEKYLTAVAHKVSRGEYIPPAMVPTFGTVAAEWLAGKSDHHPASVQGWRVHVRHLAALHSIKMDRIDVALIERLRDDLRQSLSAQTVAAIMTTMGAVYKHALRLGHATVNTAALAERPRRAVAELAADDDTPHDRGLRAVRPDEILSAHEISRLLDAADAGLYRTLLATIAATGLRPEEAYALRWADLQLGDTPARLFVRRSLSWSRGLGEKGHVKPKFYQPKTKAGFRNLPLPGALVAMLKAWRLQCPPSTNDLVFCTADGSPLQRSAVLRQGLYPALRRAGLRQCNIKTLRHSFASGLIAAHAPITEVQHKLGHSNPATTLKVYSHWLEDADTGAAERFAAGFLQASDEISVHSVSTLGKTDMIGQHIKPRKLLRK